MAANEILQWTLPDGVDAKDENAQFLRAVTGEWPEATDDVWNSEVRAKKSESYAGVGPVEISGSPGAPPESSFLGLLVLLLIAGGALVVLSGQMLRRSHR